MNSNTAAMIMMNKNETVPYGDYLEQICDGEVIYEGEISNSFYFKLHYLETSDPILMPKVYPFGGLDSMSGKSGIDAFVSESSFLVYNSNKTIYDDITIPARSYTTNDVFMEFHGIGIYTVLYDKLNDKPLFAVLCSNLVYRLYNMIFKNIRTKYYKQNGELIITPEYYEFGEYYPIYYKTEEYIYNGLNVKINSHNVRLEYKSTAYSGFSINIEIDGTIEANFTKILYKYMSQNGDIYNSKIGYTIVDSQSEINIFLEDNPKYSLLFSNQYSLTTSGFGFRFTKLTFSEISEITYKLMNELLQKDNSSYYTHPNHIYKISAPLTKPILNE